MNMRGEFDQPDVAVALCRVDREGWTACVFGNDVVVVVLEPADVHAVDGRARPAVYCVNVCWLKNHNNNIVPEHAGRPTFSVYPA